jgi:hypothetical protein
MVEPGQLHGDPSRKALWNRLLGYGKAGRTGNPITCWAVAALGENPLAGLRGQNPPSVGLGGNTQGSHLSCYRGTAPAPLLTKGVRTRRWGSARAPFYQAYPTTSYHVVSSSL